MDEAKQRLQDGPGSLTTKLNKMNLESLKSINETFSNIESKAIANFKKEKLQKNKIQFQRFASLRYLGQDHSV